MKAAIYNGKRNILLGELETPKAGEHDIVVKNLYASICGTDVAVYSHGPGTGHRITLGGEFGHEVVSEVVEVGAAVKDIQVGDRIYPYPRLAKGDPKRAGTLGGFSEYMLLPDPKWNEQIYRVSDKISDREACLIEPFTVGCRAARRFFPKEMKQTILSYQMRVDEETGQVFRGSLVEIENSLEAKQRYVNYNKPHGLIQVICIDGIDIICHDEGKLLQYPPNRVWVDENGEALDIFCGNILVVRHNDEGEFTSILPKDIAVINKFLKPVYRAGTKLVVLPTEEWLEVYKDESAN